jgi:hypothetical protein
MATITVSKNVATVSFPSGWATNMVIEVISNSSFEQQVELDMDGSTKENITGTGEKNSVETVKIPDGTKKLMAKFTHGSDKKPSELQYGGPFDIGVMKLLMITAENGDDEDFNDVVLQIRGKGGK